MFACRNKHVNRALEIAESLLADSAARAQGDALAGTLKKAAHRPDYKAKVSHDRLQSHPPFMCSPLYRTGPSEICRFPLSCCLTSCRLTPLSSAVLGHNPDVS